VKVALIVEWLDAWRGGAETSTQQFLHHLMDMGVSLHVFTRSRPSPTPGMKVHTITGASMSRTRRSMTFAIRVERLVRAESFDVIHAISPCLCADIYQPRGGTVAETIERNVATRHRPAMRYIKRTATKLDLKQRYMLAMERKIMGAGRRPLVVAISDYVVRQLKNHYDLPDSRIRKVYNGVDVDDPGAERRTRDRKTIRDDFAIPPDDMLVLLVAHNFRLKGVMRWMEALAGLVKRGERNIRSLVVGRGDSQRWRRLALRLGIKDYLTFTGSSDRVRMFRHAADILVHPTYYDPCSRVVLESMASGLPCITTGWDGASEMVEDGRNGFVLHDLGNTDELMDRVYRLRDVGLRRDFAETARQVAPHISMARHAAEMVSLYEEMASARTRLCS